MIQEIRSIDKKSVGHIIPGLITYLLGLVWIYKTSFDYIVFKQANKNNSKQQKPRFVTRICFGSMFNFKNKFLKIFNISDAMVGLVLGFVGVLLFVIFTE